MSKPKEEIINDITNQVAGNEYADCYIGTTKEISQSLLDDHKVSKDKGYYIYRGAESDEAAKEIEKHFRDKGMDGRDGGGD